MWRYVIAYLVGPDLGIIHVVVLVGEVARYNVVDLLLYKGTDVVENCLLLLAHQSINYIALPFQINRLITTSINNYSH